MKKIIFLALLFSSFSIFNTGSSIAKSIPQNSSLCKSKNLDTMIGFTTQSFDIAICKGMSESNDGFYYIGRNKVSKDEIYLPITEQNDPQWKNPWILKARNGEYTYQVAIFDKMTENISLVSVSVYKNGTRVFHQTSKNALVGEYNDI